MGSASGARNECGFGPIGQFWGMIDADDWWIANDKIERQIEKLMTDKTAVACGGTTLQTCSDIADRVGVKSSLERWSFVDYLTGTQNLYVHLSSILWRNIFKGKDGFSPKLIDQGWPRDEWSRTLAGLAESRGWICCVPMPVSQYNFTGIGVWSSLSQSERNERNNLADKKIRAMLPLSYKMFLTLYPKISNSILKLIFLKKIRFRKQLWLLFFNLFRKNT